jgi:hypothetical protein
MTLSRPSSRLAALLAALSAAFVLLASFASPAVATTSGQASGSQAAGLTLWPGAHWCGSTGWSPTRFQGVMCLNLEYEETVFGRRFVFSLEMKCGTEFRLVTCVSAQANYAAIHKWQTLPEQLRCVPSGPACKEDDVNRDYHAEYFYLQPGEIVQFLVRGDARKGVGGFTLPDGWQGYVHLQPPTITITG